LGSEESWKEKIWAEERKIPNIDWDAPLKHVTYVRRFDARGKKRFYRADGPRKALQEQPYAGNGWIRWRNACKDYKLGSGFGHATKSDGRPS
jgi:hypothetical protein